MFYIWGFGWYNQSINAEEEKHMSLTLEKIFEAKNRIAPYTTRTPLIRLEKLDEYLGCQVYLKAECMQITGAFKLRGAVNKIRMLTPEQLSCGIVAASSGNHGKAVAYTAKKLGAKATIVMPYTAPAIKVNAIKELGAEVVQCETSERFDVAERICRERNATMVPPYNDEDIMAGQGTAGIEILEQCPEIDTIIVPVSGGGLIGGVSTAVKGMDNSVKVYGAEPAALPRYSASLAAGKPVKVEQKKSIADALVSQMPGDQCYPYVAANVDGFFDVEDEYLLKAWKLLLTEGKIFCEPSSAITVGAVLQGLAKVKKDEKVCFLISGGSAGLDQLKVLENVTI